MNHPSLLQTVLSWLWVIPGTYKAIRVWVHSAGKRHRAWRAAGAFLVWPVLAPRTHLHLPPRARRP